MVFGELTSVCRSVQCVSKANIASFLACGLHIFYCEASNLNLGVFRIRFTDFHFLYHGNERTLLARNLHVELPIFKNIYHLLDCIAQLEHFGML
jgi:hypothetical protein